ncbi:hypothetical protein EXIGLDRAFT_110003 [Exidia glandulosa HHB12029]|uniref:Uncharacterized protein n=1 Tax=Exidia glandulosa HHB12029 TaxID=1314781 RepID=A0A165GQW0_EXIGL|nr:hypothetical protein EXIGLDRAFT_110003 [Exidia glandulosa HHB12029]
MGAATMKQQQRTRRQQREDRLATAFHRPPPMRLLYRHGSEGRRSFEACGIKPVVLSDELYRCITAREVECCMCAPTPEPGDIGHVQASAARCGRPRTRHVPIVCMPLVSRGFAGLRPNRIAELFSGVRCSVPVKYHVTGVRRSVASVKTLTYTRRRRARQRGRARRRASSRTKAPV